jgi:hypothetical protein
VGAAAQFNPAFNAHVESVLNAETKNDVTVGLREILTRKDVKPEEMTMIIKLAKDKADSLNGVLEPQGTKPGSAFDKIAAGLKSLFSWQKKAGHKGSDVASHYLTQVQNGTDPSEAVDKAMKQAILQSHPNVVLWNDFPNMVVGDDSNIRLIFPKETKIYPNRIYNPETQKFELNPEVSHNE